MGETSDRVGQLEAEVAGLRESMRTRSLIDQAKGVLAVRLGVHPDEAFGYLSRLSQNANVRVAEISAGVVSALSQYAKPTPGHPARRGALPSADGPSDRLEALGGFGWAEWNAAGEPTQWSPGLSRLLGQRPPATALPLSRLLELVLPEDVPAARASLGRVRDEGCDVAQELRIQRLEPGRVGGSVRHLRVTAQPVPDPSGAPGILAVVQDITEDRRRDREISRAGEQLAAQRVRDAAELAHTNELRSLLFPRPEQNITHDGLRLLARHTAPTAFRRFRGDFYDIIPVSDGIVLTVGDVFSSGVAAANAMVRLRHSARALSLAGLAPADVLRLLNLDLTGDTDPPRASVVTARFHPASATMSWAQAGHFAPVLLRGERARPLARPGGVALGLRPDAEYGQATQRLRPRDVVAFYTDGVLDPAGAPVRALVRELSRAYHRSGSGDLHDEFLRTSADEACLVTVEVAP